MSDFHYVQSPDDEINLRELITILWHGKLLIASIMSIAATLSIAVSLSMPNIYQATTILAPKSSGGSGGLARLASQYSGLANLAGVDLGSVSGGGLSKPAIALEKMKSLSFFVKHLYEDVLPDLVAAKTWDPVTRQLEYEGTIYDAASDEWLREASARSTAKPSAQEAHRVFLSLLSISEDAQTGLITVSIDHISPDTAKEWVDLMVQRVSEDLRAKDIKEAQDSISFLKAQRDKTSLVSLDEVFAQLIEEQTKTIMLANVA